MVQVHLQDHHHHVPLEHHQLEPLLHFQPIGHQHHHVAHCLELPFQHSPNCEGEPHRITIGEITIFLGCGLLHLINVFNGLVFHELYITASKKLLPNRIIKPVAKFILTIANKDTLPCLFI